MLKKLNLNLDTREIKRTLDRIRDCVIICKKGNLDYKKDIPDLVQHIFDERQFFDLDDTEALISIADAICTKYTDPFVLELLREDESGIKSLVREVLENEDYYEKISYTNLLEIIHEVLIASTETSDEIEFTKPVITVCDDLTERIHNFLREEIGLTDDLFDYEENFEENSRTFRTRMEVDLYDILLTSYIYLNLERYARIIEREDNESAIEDIEEFNDDYDIWD